MELFLTILLIFCAVANLICLVIVALGVWEEYGILVALLGVFCCQIITFAWGWIFWQNEIKWYVMPVWTIAIIAGGILRYQLYGPSY